MSPSGNKHGRIAANITGSLAPYVTANKLGAVYAAETGFYVPGYGSRPRRGFCKSQAS